MIIHNYTLLSMPVEEGINGKGSRNRDTRYTNIENSKQSMPHQSTRASTGRKELWEGSMTS